MNVARQSRFWLRQIPKPHPILGRQTLIPASPQRVHYWHRWGVRSRRWRRKSFTTWSQRSRLIPQRKRVVRWIFVCVDVKTECLCNRCQTKEAHDLVLYRNSRLDLAKPCHQTELTRLDNLSDPVLRAFSSKGHRVRDWREVIAQIPKAFCPSFSRTLFIRYNVNIYL